MPASRPFRITTAVYAMFVAAAGLLALAGYWLLDATADRIVATQAERTSIAWTDYTSAQLARIDEIAAGAPINGFEQEFLEGIREFGGVFRFKLFDVEGRLRLVSDDLRTGSVAPVEAGEHSESARAVTFGDGWMAVVTVDGQGRERIRVLDRTTGASRAVTEIAPVR